MENLDTTLAKIAEKLGTSAERLWPLLVQERFINALSFEIFGALLVVGGITAYYLANKVETTDYGKEETCGLIMLAGVAAVFLGIVFMLANMTNLLCPEAAALKYILSR